LFIEYAKLTFRIYAHSLKDKRQISRPIIDKARHKFNAAISEVEGQDCHQTLILGIAAISGNLAHAQNSINEIARFIEFNTDGDLINTDSGGDSI